MSYRAERITRTIKSKDNKLFCAKNAEGKLCVYREGFRLERYVMDDESTLYFSRPDHHLVMALTDTWNLKGRAVDWGLEPIMARIDSLDLWRRDMVKEIELNDLKHAASCERHLKNETEAFLKDFRPQFAKATDEVVTGSLSKTDPRKKREKSGHYK